MMAVVLSSSFKTFAVGIEDDNLVGFYRLSD
jgi:hypothetical protein